MLRGVTGAVRFHSAALDADMIAFFAAVPSTGWRVMVPRPVPDPRPGPVALVAAAPAFGLLVPREIRQLGAAFDAMLRVTRALLETLGCRVTTARSGGWKPGNTGAPRSSP